MEPLTCTGRQSSMKIETVGAAVERYQGLMVTSLAGHGGDLGRGDIGSVGCDYRDRAFKGARQGVEQVALMNLTSHSADVPPRAGNSGRVYIRGVQLKASHPRGDRGTCGTGSAAKINNNCRVT